MLPLPLKLDMFTYTLIVQLTQAMVSEYFKREDKISAS